MLRSKNSPIFYGNEFSGFESQTKFFFFTFSIFFRSLIRGYPRQAAARTQRPYATFSHRVSVCFRGSSLQQQSDAFTRGQTPKPRTEWPWLSVNSGPSVGGHARHWPSRHSSHCSSMRSLIRFPSGTKNRQSKQQGKSILQILHSWVCHTKIKNVNVVRRGFDIIDLLETNKSKPRKGPDDRRLTTAPQEPKICSPSTAISHRDLFTKTHVKKVLIYKRKAVLRGKKIVNKCKKVFVVSLYILSIYVFTLPLFTYLQPCFSLLQFAYPYSLISIYQR